MYRVIGKRILDVTVGFLALLVLWPVILIIAIIVRLRLGSPVIFRQRRPGKDTVPFVLLKFRTMTEDRNGDGALRTDAERLTRLGRFLRATSLDELPELWNVLRGDMSLVGPRPLLMEYLPRYSETQRRRHDVRPGITGLAQASGRNALTWEQRFALDLEYCRTVSLREDVRILFSTFRSVVRREGIAQAGHETAAEFMGTVPGDARDESQAREMR